MNPAGRERIAAARWELMKPAAPVIKPLLLMLSLGPVASCPNSSRSVSCLKVGKCPV